MFGNKGKLSKEDIVDLQKAAETGELLSEQLLGGKTKAEGNFHGLKDSHKQMETYVTQALTNVDGAREMATSNVDAVAVVCRHLDVLADEMRHTDADYERLGELLRQCEQDSQDAVEQQKHFTTPSKVISELPETLHGENDDHIHRLEHMQELGKQMGVLSLNAAIEAGRMGETGHSFVSAAEEVRNLSREYEKEVIEMKAAVVENDIRVKSLEETVSTLVKLLKDNNMAVARLMRSAGESRKSWEDANGEAVSQEMQHLREGVLGIREQEEEMLKAEERNRMQLEDVMSELELCQNNQTELMENWQKAVDLAAEYQACIAKEGGLK